mgnify:FL=1
MILDVDFLIGFFKKHSEESNKGEMGEQDAATAPASPSSGGGSVPKWADTYTITRGKANKIGVASEKWKTRLTRGAANKIW